MKERLITLIDNALDTLIAEGTLPAEAKRPAQIDRTKDKSHGDFATNIALMLAKPAGMKPRDLAEKLIAALPADNAVAKVEIAGPGFINFFQADDWLTGLLDQALADEHLGVARPAQAQTVVVDYSSPNLAKEMHVGHLRSSIIGDAVVRTLEFLGHKVVRQNHVGDWGTQFGMLLAYLEEQKSEESDTELSRELGDLEGFYRAAKQRFDESDAFATRARSLVVKLQAGDEDCLALWREFNSVSLSHCQAVYDRLGVSLTPADVRGESAYNDDLAQVVSDLDAKGLLSEDQGAQCVFMDEFKNKEGAPLPVIVKKADGGYLYATTDLAALRYRAGTLHADRMLYFVDQRQALHFQQIFSLAKRAGFVPENTELEHMGFGTMNGPDGRPFKTRDGGTVKLIDLLDEAEQRAYALVRDKNPELDDQALRTIAHAVGIGAVKYADLSKNRSSDYIFNFEQMLSFEGNTAPYLLYAYTRVASVFRKAGLDMGDVNGDFLLQEEAEQALAARLVQFGEVLESVAEKGLPHLLCTYLYDVAGLFSTFYEHCPILSGDNEALKQSRLKLAALTARTLKQGMELLGLSPLERM
ncbi:arginine--tRNA ligase [Alcanivorax sp. HI0033]|uniref:arginine--tRNA ligase n=1 Tax=unclassified Alcanivorax TaxID=2638842 RepID=UPI0007B7B78C|nr:MULTISPECIES: arginine--tRNA ligase [unclassified Alcanivorax]KZX75502.1 arginine--tRNA ligase [Alcanivorax sp. HI0011]KZX77830.1 arginine--tRNA ligase [Alcanivorax sp. HI0013]KZY25151.1 arginine--tRNA ligase [Alcanivorax sp. HI0035]KZX65417.1 arginine--tRNA ligase [Alcanivorax sp. HI0003]KZX73029.1 arginine--tRNA ligase [Alcanivorax sp. HI0007]